MRSGRCYTADLGETECASQRFAGNDSLTGWQTLSLRTEHNPQFSPAVAGLHGLTLVPRLANYPVPTLGHHVEAPLHIGLPRGTHVQVIQPSTHNRPSLGIHDNTGNGHRVLRSTHPRQNHRRHYRASHAHHATPRIIDLMSLGAADVLELGLAAFLALLAWVSRPWVEPFCAKLARRTGWSMLVLAVLPVALRLALLAHHPAPSPATYQEYANLLGADTLRHFRLANPAEELAPFFETLGVLQEPTYSAVAPLAPALVLMLGWVGVLLSTAAFCALVYWMLRAWTTPLWALAGGVLAVIEFGPLNGWMSSYTGGSLAAAAGCLVFGSLPRLRAAYRTRDAALLGVGLGVVLLIQPYQYALLLGCVILFFLRPSPSLTRAVPVVIVSLVPAFALMLVQNKQVTGSWTTTPATLSQLQYGVPDSLTFQAPPESDRDLTPQQDALYRAQLSYRDKDGESLRAFLLRLEYRVRFYRFFFLPALYLILPFFLIELREYRLIWIALALAVFGIGINFVAAFDLAMLAPATGLFVLASVVGLQRLGRTNRQAAWLILALCGAHFVLWYGLHVTDSSPMLRYETWDGINHPDEKAAFIAALAAAPGKQLVVVRYSERHPYQEEWVHNEADLGAAKVIWARDLGQEEDQKLREAFPGRTVWLLEPDQNPPGLRKLSASGN